MNRTNPKLLTQANFDILNTLPHIVLIDIYCALYDLPSHLLTQANFMTLATYAHLDTNHVSLVRKKGLREDILHIALKRLREDNCLTQDNFDMVVKHIEPSATARLIATLHKANLSTPDNFQEVLRLAEYHAVISALEDLHKAGGLTRANFKSIIAHREPLKISPAIFELNRNNCLTQGNFDALIQHNNPEEAAKALVELREGKCLTPKNRLRVIRHPNPYKEACGLRKEYENKRLRRRQEIDGDTTNESKSNASRLEAINFDSKNVPEEYKCIISQEIMTYPVYAPNTPEAPKLQEAKFDDFCISSWSKETKTHPTSRTFLTPDMLIPDKKLKKEIDDFVNNREKKYNSAKTLQRRYRISSKVYNSELCEEAKLVAKKFLSTDVSPLKLEAKFSNKFKAARDILAISDNDPKKIEKLAEVLSTSPSTFTDQFSSTFFKKLSTKMTCVSLERGEKMEKKYRRLSN